MNENTTRIGWSRLQMAWLTAQDIPDGAYVNLGIGMPEKVAEYLPSDRDAMYHSENGILGMGPAPSNGAEDPDLINAGKKPVTELPGAAYFHHADSFSMIRGGHIDICILGAMQVSVSGDLANWSTGEKDAIPAVGGAMDLAVGAGAVFVMTEHTTRQGNPKLVDACTYPLTGQGVVTRVYTNLAIIDVTKDGFLIRGIAPAISMDDILQRTTGRVEAAIDIHVPDAPDELAA